MMSVSFWVLTSFLLTMGYSKTIKLSEEEFKDIRLDRKPEDFYPMSRAELIVNIAKGDITYKGLYYSLNLIALNSKDKIRYDLTQEYDSDEYSPKGTLRACGWSYSQNYDIEDIKDVLQSVCEDLYIFSHTVPLPNFFDENERWSQWMNEVVSKIDYVKDEASDIFTHTIFDSHQEWIEDSPVESNTSECDEHYECSEHEECDEPEL